ncbi:heavy metal-binding domain-containing protein [Nodosilinea nodulosa]|uniref:heavy metal-binding domain-containing protein n=1 Tax=Nodosilinea nodulosa TaxID=416001 RepID=UPI0002FCF046|nr:heavy metal-binding domain-containing protein [Nodosilinea nodulosa]
MPFWESANDKSRREAQEATRRALERGQIPYRARHRLEEQRKRGDRFFTSDLSSNEHLLTREAGYEPIGLVMGTAFYKVSYWGYFNGYRNTTGELTSLSQAQLAARELAIARLQQEATILGAHGVIGVRLKLGGYDWSARTVEFTAIGTAIRIPDRAPDPNPFTSDLSGQEFWQLHQAGYYPRGLVLGICSYYVHTDWNTRNITRGGFLGRGSSQNQEIVQYTQGFQIARHLAAERLTADIQKHGGEGAVGMHIDMGIEDIEYEVNDTKYHDLLAHFVAVGTAIVHDPQPAAGDRKSPLLYYNLADGKVAQLTTNPSSTH